MFQVGPFLLFWSGLCYRCKNISDQRLINSWFGLQNYILDNCFFQQQKVIVLSHAFLSYLLTEKQRSLYQSSLSWHLPIIYFKNPTYLLIIWDLKSLIIIFERSWLSWEFPGDWRKADIIPAVEKDDLESYRQVSSTFVLRKVMEKILLKTISKHMKDKKVTGISHNWFMKEKANFASLMTFYGEIWWPWGMKEEQQV